MLSSKLAQVLVIPFPKCRSEYGRKSSPDTPKLTQAKSLENIWNQANYKIGLKLARSFISLICETITSSKVDISKILFYHPLVIFGICQRFWTQSVISKIKRFCQFVPAACVVRQRVVFC